MAGAREWGEVHSYPSANESYDDHGYVLEVNGSGQVTKIGSGTGTGSDDNPFGVNYVSSEDEDGNVETLDAGTEIDVVRESAAFPVVADAEDYTIGDVVHVSGTNDGHVSAADTGNDKVGVAVETKDLSGGSDGDEHILVAFSFTGR